MDTLEKIKTEYMLYEPKNMPDNLEGAKDFITVYIDDMEESIIGVKESIRENSIDEVVARIKNVFYVAFGFVEEDTEWYGEDTEVLLKHRELAEKFGGFFSSMKDALTEDNFINICSLAQFTNENYLANYNYLESLRDAVEYSARGITFFGVGEDTQEEFEEFFTEEFLNITNKGIQKNKN